MAATAEDGCRSTTAGWRRWPAVATTKTAASTTSAANEPYPSATYAIATNEESAKTRATPAEFWWCIHDGPLDAIVGCRRFRTRWRRRIASSAHRNAPGHAAVATAHAGGRNVVNGHAATAAWPSPVTASATRYRRSQKADQTEPSTKNAKSGLCYVFSVILFKQFMRVPEYLMGD